MRSTITVATALATAAGAALVMLNVTNASALPCPQGTRYQYVAVGGQRVGACLPYTYCDPGPCDPPPTGAPEQ